MTPRLSLTAAVSGERRELDGAAGRLSFYVAGPPDAAPRPMVLVHSVNAAASAYEVRPLFERYAGARRVYALDLPGFGFSDRADRDYTPRLMTDAVRALAEAVHAEHGAAPDALALSLGCEYLARAAVEAPTCFASLALVSPTGLNGSEPRRGGPGSHRGMAGMLAFLRAPLVGPALFAALTTRASIGYFLRRTFGSPRVDPGLVDYAYQTSHQPGARFAPLRFLSGFLFSGDAYAVYESIAVPVWIAHGVRGDFQDYRLAPGLAEAKGWTVTSFDSGALPHYEHPAEFARAYEDFLASTS